MERILNIIKVVVAGVLIFALIVFGALYYEANKTEAKYQEAVSYMNKGDWGNAVWDIAKIPHYKDSSQLYNYMYPNKLFYEHYADDEEAINGYKAAITFIDAQKASLKKVNSGKYLNDLLDLDKVLNFKIVELGAKVQNDALENEMKDITAVITKGDYTGALSKLQGISDTSIYAGDKQELIKYVNLLNAVKAKDQNAILTDISLLDPNYNGTMAQDIKTTVQGYADITKWNSLYSSANPGTSTTQANTQTQTVASTGNNQSQSGTLPGTTANGVNAPNNTVSIGMSRANLISALGNPSRDNVISNKYGTFEEMVYKDKDIYLENNAVIAVK